MNMRSFIRKRIQPHLDLVIFSYIVIFGISVTMMSAFLGIGQYGMGIGALLASAVYGIYRYSDLVSLNKEDISSFSIQHYKISTIMFFILVSAAIILNRRQYQYRPPVFFILIAIAWSTIVIDISTIHNQRWLVYATLIKISFISIIFRATRYYEMATIPGNDTQFHLDLAMLIYRGGSLPVGETISHPKYIFTSLWHIALASIRHVLLTSIWDTLFLAVVVPFVLITVFGSYALSKAINGSVSHGLGAAFLISFTDFFILRGVSAISTSSYVIPFTIILLIVFYRYHDWRGTILATGIITAILLTHQLSAFASMIIVCSIIVGVGVHHRWFSINQKPISRVASGSVFLLIGIGTISWWMVIPSGEISFFQGMVLRVSGKIASLLTTSGSSSGYGVSLSQYSLISNLLYTFGSDLLFALALLGVLLIGHHTNQSPRQLYLYTPTVVLFIFIYPLTMLGLDDVLLPHRILVFLQLCFVIFAAVGIVHALRQASSSTLQTAVIGIVLFILVFSMITTPYTNRNSPVYLEDREPRVDLKDSEVSAVLWLLETDNSSDVYIDSHMRRRQILTLTNIHRIDDSDNMYHTYQLNESPETGTYIVRSYFDKLDDVAPTGTFGEQTTRIDGSSITKQYKTGNKKYDNGKVTIYIKS